MQGLTDKVVFGYSLGRDRILDVIEMARIGRGIGEDQLLREPSIWTIVNANSPLQYDMPMLWGMIELAKRNQPVCLTPFTLSGAMGAGHHSGRRRSAERRGTGRGLPSCKWSIPARRRSMAGSPPTSI